MRPQTMPDDDIRLTIDQSAGIDLPAIYEIEWRVSGAAARTYQAVALLDDSDMGTDRIEATIPIELADRQGGEVDRALSQPIKLSWRKTRSVWKYPLRYKEQVVNRMKEHYGTSVECGDDEDDLAHATCGILIDGSGSYIRHSQGFCCQCGLDDIVYGEKNRGGIDCGNVVQAISQSFHCIKPDNLWYVVFEVEPPMMMYEIDLEMEMPMPDHEAEELELEQLDDAGAEGAEAGVTSQTQAQANLGFTPVANGFSSASYDAAIASSTPVVLRGLQNGQGAAMADDQEPQRPPKTRTFRTTL